jgi:surface antigen
MYESDHSREVGSTTSGQIVAITGLMDWLPYGKGLTTVALGALLAVFLGIVVAVLLENRRRKRAKEIDPRFLDQPARRTDFLWEERYGGKDYE